MRELSAFLCLVCLGAPAAGGDARDPERDARSIGNRRQLLFDDRFFAERRGLEHRLHPPRKTGDLCVVSEKDAGLGGNLCVLHDSGIYHLWYTAGSCFHYARSEDGIRWTLPSLGVVPGEASAAMRNVVVGYGAGEVKDSAQGLMVFLDPNASVEERFRLVSNPQEYSRWIQIFSSPDGIRWRRTHCDVLTFRDARHHLDSQNVIFWDARIKKYVAYVRRNLRERGSQGRSVARAESARLDWFPQVEDCPVVFRSDTRHPGQLDPRRGELIAVLDTYTNGAIAYPWAEDAYFMFPAEYYHYTAALGEFRSKAPVNAGSLEVRFAASRDGIAWRRFDAQPLVGLGMTGEFDSRRIYMAYGIVPAPNGRELYMYYVGMSDTHGWNRDETNNRLLGKAGLAPTGPSAISRVVLRRDGFVSVHAGPEGGEFTTPPLRFQGECLLLNIDTSATGEARVELQDAGGTPVPGYASEDCDIIFTTNDVNRLVRWKGSPSLAPLAGRAIRLHATFRDCDIYAFQFADAPPQGTAR